MPTTTTSRFPSGSGFREPNLAFIHQETLTSIVRLRSGRQQTTDAEYFRGQIREALKTAREEALSAGNSSQAIQDSQLAVVSFLNETLRELRAPVFDEWLKYPLLEELFGLKTGGEVFFENLERLLGQEDSPALGDTLEVYILCLMLGYAGKYSASGREELLALRETAMARLRSIRGSTPEFSCSWRPPVETEARRTTGEGKRLLIAAAICMLGLLLIFFVYKTTLGKSVGELQSMRSNGAAR